MRLSSKTACSGCSMILLVPSDIAKRFRGELRRARRFEVGGVLMGEHVSDETFRIVDFTTQRYGGTRVHFVRDPRAHAAQLEGFFERTGGDYTRFNYLGEWHSHPSFPPTPSASDIAEMVRLVDDPEVGVSFSILLILRLRFFRRLVGTATLFARGQSLLPARLFWELTGNGNAMLA
jgi:integrative and conjugative element protein (TIGR02256 family)